MRVEDGRAQPLVAGAGVACVVATLFMGACGASSDQTPRVVEPAESVVTEAEPVEPTETAESPPAERWRPPLPELDLPAELSEQQLEAARACARMHQGVTNASPADLMTAADCMAEIPAPGREILLRRVVLTRHPNAPEARAALRLVATRYEQIGQQSMAMDHLEQYLRSFPVEPDARALGQRAVCLAHALGVSEDLARLLDLLERSYARTGFSRPTDDELSALCQP
jgi:hypothetical protein